MNTDQLEKAEMLTKRIKQFQQAYDNIEADYRNAYSLPQDLYETHKAQIKEWLESELKRMREEFNAL